jgi:formylglycine-generating enzyme required for sulfatase activity
MSPPLPCAQVSPSPQRIIRGGATTGAPVKQRTGLLIPDEPDDRSRIIGFRCARPAGAP